MISLPRLFTRYYMCSVWMCVCVSTHECETCHHCTICRVISTATDAQVKGTQVATCIVQCSRLTSTLVYTYHESHLNYISMATLRRCVDGWPAISILCVHVALCLCVQEPEGLQPALLSRKVHRSSAWGGIIIIIIHICINHRDSSRRQNMAVP